MEKPILTQYSRREQKTKLGGGGGRGTTIEANSGAGIKTCTSK